MLTINHTLIKITYENYFTFVAYKEIQTITEIEVLTLPLKWICTGFNFQVGKKIGFAIEFLIGWIFSYFLS